MSITDDLLNFEPEQSIEEKALEEIQAKRHNAFADPWGCPVRLC